MAPMAVNVLTLINEALIDQDSINVKYRSSKKKKKKRKKKKKEKEDEPMFFIYYCFRHQLGDLGLNLRARQPLVIVISMRVAKTHNSTSHQRVATVAAYFHIVKCC